MVFHTAEQEDAAPLPVLDPRWETPEDVRAMQSALVRPIMALCAARHRWYRRLFAERGIDPGAIRSLADLDRLPTTSKATFIENPEAFRLEPDPEAPQEYVLADVTYTAGTTSGVPTPIYQTAYDLRGVLFAQLRMAAIRGLVRGDRVVNLYPFAPYPHGGWLRPTQAAATLGAPVVAATGGAGRGRFPITRRLGEVAELTVETNPTVVWGVPSYVERVLHEIIEAGGRLPALRMLAVSGEPCPAGRRAKLIDLAESAGAGEPFVSDSLGASELQFSLVECPGGGGFHHPAPELAHIEVVDEDGRSVPDGDPGRLAYTHLDRRGTVLIRFLVGDRAVLDRSACPECGWLGGRVVRHLGREGNLIKVRGALINIDAVHAAVAALEDVLDHRLEVETREGADALIATLAVAADADRATAREEVVDRVRAATGVRPEVEFAGLDEIWTPDERMKPARFIDRRDHAGRDRSSAK
jgi:phenylacetate-coenzyme A ligase PaaK-like adenylate-forming protein